MSRGLRADRRDRPGALIAVFVPLAFISGLTGQFYRQFALTIAISTVISAVNSLTLSPGVGGPAAPHSPRCARRTSADPRARWPARLVLPRSSTAPSTGSNAYSGGVTRGDRAQIGDDGRLPRPGRRRLHRCSRRSPVASCRRRTSNTWSGFAQLPDGASLDRSESVDRKRMGDHRSASSQAPLNSIAFPGCPSTASPTAPTPASSSSPSTSSTTARTPELSAAGHRSKSLNKQFGSIQDAFIAVFPPAARRRA